MKEGIYKLPDISTDLRDMFILRESWKKTRDMLQEQHPNAKIKYSYKTKQFRIIYPLPSDFYKLQSIKIL